MPAMDGARGPNTNTTAPEQLLDVFKAAALSVTKLYKTAAVAQSKARSDGYQDCLDDLLAFLDRENIGVGDGEGWRIRRWATERLDGRETSPQGGDSEDESDAPNKPEPMVNPEPRHPLLRPDAPARAESAPATATISVEAVTVPATTIATPPVQFTAPSQDTFTFQSSHPYPNIADLDLSDSRAMRDTMMSSPSTRSTRARHNGPRATRGNNLGRGAGSKRKLNLGEIFDVGSLGGKDMFGNGNKRSRHV